MFRLNGEKDSVLFHRLDPTTISAQEKFPSLCETAGTQREFCCSGGTFP